MELADLVRQVPPWALWLEMGLGWIGLLAVAERVHQGRTPVPLTALVAACVAFGGCGLLLRAVDPAFTRPDQSSAADP